MTTKLELNDQSPDANKNQTPPTNGLTMSPRLKQAIENLLLMPEYQAISRKQGEAAAVFQATKFLRDTRPDFFNLVNPGDVLVKLFVDLES